MAVEGHTTPSRMGVGVIGASPLRPGWALTAHLPALAALPDYELRAVATSTEASARAAAEARRRSGGRDGEAAASSPPRGRGPRRRQAGDVRVAARRRCRADG